jgi:hypothetical protein
MALGQKMDADANKKRAANSTSSFRNRGYTIIGPIYQDLTECTSLISKVLHYSRI